MRTLMQSTHYFIFYFAKQVGIGNDNAYQGQKGNANLFLLLLLFRNNETQLLSLQNSLAAAS